MKRSVMKKWVEALRSGEFKQGIGSLCKDGKHCCLGVLTDIALCEGVVEYQGEFLGSCNYGAGCVSGILPSEVADWAGMHTRNGALRLNGHLVHLWQLNDGANCKVHTFKELAGIIEANWKVL
jgi:hypothetical protein